MKTILAILLLAAVGASCRSGHMTVPEGTARTWSASDRGLSWLVQNQRPDGYWGTDRHRVALTSLATLAFLSHGETPASRDYGKAVENALRALLHETEGESDLPRAEAVIVTWCLAEAYGLTRVPMLLDAARKQSAHLNATSATAWHVFAAHSLYLSGANPDAGKKLLADLYAGRTNGVLDQATQLLLVTWSGNWKNSAPYLDGLRQQGTANWREAHLPLQTAFVLSIALLHVGGTDWLEWNRQFYPDLVKNQVCWGDHGWWTPESLGVRDTPEVRGMSSDDVRIYTTSLMLLTLQRPRILPSYRPPAEEEDRQGLDNDDDIEIKIEI